MIAYSAVYQAGYQFPGDEDLNITFQLYCIEYTRIYLHYQSNHQSVKAEIVAPFPFPLTCTVAPSW